MKIVHVFKDAYPPLVAGITRYIADLSSEFVARGHEVSVVVAGVKTSRVDIESDGVRIVRCAELGRALSMPLSPELANTIRRESCDVIHVHMPNPIGEWGVLRRGGDVAHVVTFHAQLGKQRVLAPLYSPLQSAVLKRASRVLVSSSAMSQVSELKAAHEVGNVEVLPFGVSPKLIGSTVARDDRPSGSPMRLLFVGRLVYYKGIEVLLDALEQIENCTLTVVGEGPLGEMVERRCEGELSGRVTWLRGVDDDALRLVYADHDVFVLPSVSRAEAFGLAMAEGMANGLAVVSTRLQTGTDWVNEHGASGLVVEPGSVSQLTAALRELQADPELRQRLASGARTRALTHMSFTHHADAIEAIYCRASGIAPDLSGQERRAA